MSNKSTLILLTGLFCVSFVAGCGGEYIFTIPDRIVSPPWQAVAVVRLQARVLGPLKRDVENEALRLSIADGPQRGAFTDEIGYAVAALPTPADDGKYTLLVELQDERGNEAQATGNIYVWQADKSAVAVDLDCLPEPDDLQKPAARAAMAKLAEKARIVYLTACDPGDLPKARVKLSTADYPAGPVILWRRRFTHFVRTGPLKMPKLVTESNLVMSPARLSKMLPHLKTGVCGSQEAAEELFKAGIKPIIVAEEPVEMRAVQFKSWADLARANIEE